MLPSAPGHRKADGRFLQSKGGDPEEFYEKGARIGKGSFGEVFRGSGADVVDQTRILLTPPKALTSAPRRKLLLRSLILKMPRTRLRISSRRSRCFPNVRAPT